ncbi:MAG TPA: cytochrome c biogenesis protein CcdA, partial [Solirubrobacteraceae bacterium]|nr:cytochrome c biogenesis protein CcdA [Solirubrobacteraceae bacterium]
MLLLIAIAFVAGAGTALTPCVLPVLPALLSAGATGGRRRPLGIVIGLTATFTLVVGGLASVVGLTSGVVRGIAIAALLAFGATLLIPALGARVEARLSRIGWLAPSSAGDGFWSGLGVGGALGLVYTPCAGPILAAVISVAARHHTSLKTLEIALAYGLGSAVVLLALALGGRRVVARIRAAGRGERLQRVLGAVIVASAVLIATNLDLRFESSLARNLPAVFSNPTSALERAGGVERRLTKLRGRARFRPHGGRSRRAAPGRPGAPAASLENLGVAPDFTATQRWFNTGGRALSLGSLRGRVVLVDFWTYTCINCLRTLPFLKTLDARYRAAGLTVVGVHTPE